MPNIIAKEDLVFDTIDSSANIVFKQNGTEYLQINTNGIYLPTLNLSQLNVDSLANLPVVKATSLTVGGITSTSIQNSSYINTNTLKAIDNISIEDSNGNSSITSTKLSIANIELADSDNNVVLTTSDITVPILNSGTTNADYVKATENIQVKDSSGNSTITSTSISINKGYYSILNSDSQLNVTNDDNNAKAIIDYATINYDLSARNIRIGNTLTVIGDTTLNNNMTFKNDNGSIQVIAPDGSDSQDNQVINLPRNVEKDLNIIGQKFVSVDSDYNANPMNVIFADTTDASFTVTLPAEPNLGDMIKIVDDKGTFDSNPLTIDGNGNTIEGDDTLKDDVKNNELTLIFSNSEWKVM